MKHMQINGSYKLTTTALAVVVILAVVTGLFANTLLTAGAAPALPDQQEAGGPDASPNPEDAPEAATYLDELPGSCTDEGSAGCSFTAGQLALVSSGPVDFDDAGVAQVAGDVTIPTNGIDIEIDNSDLAIEVDAQGEIVDVSGSADVPLPTTGPLAAAVVVDGARAAVGYDWGRNLGHLGVPVAPDRQYFFFTFEDSFSMRTGFDQLFGDVAGLPLSLSAPGDVSATMVIDPLDPFLYVGGACPDFGKDDDGKDEKDERSRENKSDTDDGKASDDENSDDERAELAYGAGPGEDCGLGVSLGGHIPFEARSDNGAASDLQRFSGHIVIHHSQIPLVAGVDLDGEMIVQVGADSLAFGGNGQVRASVPLIEDALDFSFPLAHASAGMRLGLGGGAEQVDLFMSGQIDSQSAFDQLPGWLPLELPADAHVAGAARLVLNLGDRSAPLLDPASFVELEGHLAMAPAFLDELTGVDLSELLVSDAAVRVDGSGMRLTARTTSSIHPAIQFGGEIGVDAFVSPIDPLRSYVTLDGEVQIAGIDLDGAASLRLDAQGFRATGHLNTAMSQVELTGSITTTDVQLSGQARVDVPLNLLDGLLEGAPKALADAKAEVRKLDDDIAAIRAEIEAGRVERARDFDAAQAAVDEAKAEVDEIQREIDNAYARIRTLENEIEDWEEWYADLPKVEQVTYGWASLSFEVGWRGTEIGLLYTGIGTLEAARLVAQGVLDGAKLVLEGIEAGLDLIPVDADPRIIALVAARELALGTLTLAEGAVSVLTIDARLAAEIEVTLGTTGLSGAMTGQVCSGEGCLDVVGGSVSFAPEPEACLTVVGAEACLAF